MCVCFSSYGGVLQTTLLNAYNSPHLTDTEPKLSGSGCLGKGEGAGGDSEPGVLLPGEDSGHAAVPLKPVSRLQPQALSLSSPHP